MKSLNGIRMNKENKNEIIMLLTYFVGKRNFSTDSSSSSWSLPCWTKIEINFMFWNRRKAFGFSGSIFQLFFNHSSVNIDKLFWTVKRKYKTLSHPMSIFRPKQKVWQSVICNTCSYCISTDMQISASRPGCSKAD